MSFTTTTRLGMVKPTPGTGEVVNVSTQLDQNFDKVDAAVGAEPCTEAAKPSSPYHGKLIRTTDTRRLYVWNATQSSWDQIMAHSGTFLGIINGEKAAAGDNWVTCKVTGDTNSRWIVEATGKMWFGTGLASQDTNLYRGGTSLLKTDDDFEAAMFRGKQNKAGDNRLATSGTINVATYANYPGSVSIPFTKQLAATDLLVVASISAYASPGPASMLLGVRIGSTDYDIARTSYTTATGERKTAMGTRIIPGVAAGSQAIQLRWQRYAGTGTLTTSASTDDQMSVSVVEC